MDVENVTNESENHFFGHSEINGASSWNGRVITIENSSDSQFLAETLLCGERCHGEASLRAMIDTDENKKIELEGKIKDEEDHFSTRFHGEVSEDKQGHISGKVEVEATYTF